MKSRIFGWIAALLTLTLPCEAAPLPAANTAFVQAVWIPYMEMESLYAAGDARAVQEAIRARVRTAAEEGFDTLYVHVRANGDAYYASTVFPTTGGTAALLREEFDPFAFFVTVGHECGLTVHAWVNPYRIGADPNRARADDVVSADGRYYYDPSSVAVRRLVVAGVRELVKNYDIDGVQFDDYFYPEGLVQADAAAEFERDAFAKACGTVGDWRRAQVSAMIASVRAVCRTKDGCVFGVSPSYDIARNTERLYADVATWASTAGYVDYLCPQLYVGFLHEYAPFERVLEEWTALPRTDSVALHGGVARYKTGLRNDPYAGVGRGEWAAGGDILARQVQALREAGWNGAAVYGDDAPSDERDAVVVKREAEALKKILLKNNAVSR